MCQFPSEYTLFLNKLKLKQILCYFEHLPFTDEYFNLPIIMGAYVINHPS